MSKLQQRKYRFIWLLITIPVFIGFTGNSTNNYLSLSGSIANAGNNEILQLHTLEKANSTMQYKAPCANLNANDFIPVNKLGFLNSAYKWYYDNTTDTFYFRTPKVDNLSYNRVVDSSFENRIINLIITYRFDSEFKFFT